MAATITVVCPTCKNQMRASAEYIGRRGRCPSCKSLVEITPAEGESERLATQSSGRREPAEAGWASNSTDVKGWVAGLIGATTTLALYVAVFFPVRSRHLGQLFVDRGVIPYFITLFTCWGFAVLVMKYVAVKRQLAIAERELELIPLEIGLQVTADNVDQFRDHLAGLPFGEQQSILGRRIKGALEHFKHRNSVPEVQEYLSSQAEIDASGVDSGYTLLRAFIWAVPILGFIGTVMGISDAVSGLSQTMPSAQAAAEDGPGAEPFPADAGQATAGGKLMQAMGVVTDGLSTAFDTTLVALVMAILLLFPTESLRKTEYGMLDRIEQFANESLLRRMVERQKNIGEAPKIVRDALEAAFQEHQRWLGQWQTQVGELGQVIGGEFEAVVMRLQEQLAEADKLRLRTIEETAQAVHAMFEKFGKTTGSWEHATEQARQNLEQALGMSQDLNQAVAENQQRLAKAVEQQEQLIRNAAAIPPPSPPAGPSVPVAVPVAGDGAAAPLEPESLVSLENDRESGFFSRIWGRNRPAG